MSSSYRYGEVVGQVHPLVIEGRIPESQRAHWETKLMNDPRSIRELHLERPVDHTQRPEPQVPHDPNANTYVAQSHSQQFSDWISEQRDFGNGNGEPIPARPEWPTPQTTANSIPLDVIRRLPWQVQPLVARMDNAVAHAAVERFMGPGGDIEAEIAAQPGHEAYNDVQEYSEAVENWRNNPAVSLSEVERDIARSRPAYSDDGTFNPSYSRGPDNSPEAAYEHLNEMYEEVERLNPGMNFKRVSIHINNPI